MTPPLRVLLVEDSSDDAALITRVLERAGHAPAVERVQDAEGMIAALGRGPWDLVIADHSMPRFDSTRAIETLRTADLAVGCILVSGSLGEEAAVAAMRTGADDYVLKDRLDQLPMAVERTIRTGQARRARQQAEGRFRRLVELAPDGIVTVDALGIVTSLNPAFERITGFPVADALGHPFREFVHPDDAAKMRERFAGSLRMTEPITTEVQLRNRAGLYVYAEMTIAPLVDQGVPTGFFGIFRDITERRAFERELRNREARLRALLESAPDGIYTLAPSGEVQSINPAFRELLQLDFTLVGRRFREVVHPDDLPRANENFSRRLQGERVPPYELRLLRSDGTPVDVEVTSAQLLEGTEVTGTLGIVRDITQRKLAELEQLRLQTALQTAATDWTVTFDAVPLLMILVDAHGKIRRANRAAREQFAQTSERFSPTSLDELGGDPWSNVQALFVGALERGTTVTEQLELPSGRSWSLIAAPVTSPETAGVILTVRDTTDLVLLQRTVEHERTMAALGALVAGVAHEVRNPLFAISATLDAFEARFGQEPDFNRYVERLRPEVLRLSALMRDLLEYGRPSVLQPVLADVAPVVQEAAERTESAAGPRAVSVTVQAPAEPIVVRHDPARLIQVVQNLLDNALVHAPDRSAITVMLGPITRDGTHWFRIAIEDEGQGFRAEDLAHVFEPFYTRRRGGTGLGLSIVERLVEQHGGKVIAENRTEGGARVTVLLPLS